MRPAHFANVWRPGPFRCDPDYRDAVGNRTPDGEKAGVACRATRDDCALRFGCRAGPAVPFTPRRMAPRAMGLKDNGSFVGVTGTAGWTRTTGLLIHSFRACLSSGFPGIPKDANISLISGTSGQGIFRQVPRVSPAVVPRWFLEGGFGHARKSNHKAQCGCP